MFLFRTGMFRKGRRAVSAPFRWASKLAGRVPDIFSMSLNHHSNASGCETFVATDDWYKDGDIYLIFRIPSSYSNNVSAELTRNVPCWCLERYLL